jgi:hypothetical protein
VSGLVSQITAEGSAVVSCCCEKLVAEAGKYSGIKTKGNVRRLKPLPSNSSADVTVEISVYVFVTVTFKVQQGLVYQRVQ